MILAVMTGAVYLLGVFVAVILIQIIVEINVAIVIAMDAIVTVTDVIVTVMDVTVVGVTVADAIVKQYFRNY